MGWPELGTVSRESLNDARLQLHHVVQVIAGFGQNFVDARPDDSHRGMCWSSEESAFVSEQGTRGGGVRILVRPENLVVEVRAHSDSVNRKSMLGRTLPEVRSWVERVVRSVPGTPDEECIAVPEYDLPDHAVVGGAPLNPDRGALAELGRWYAAADHMLDEALSRLPESAEVRVWPHHFDIATLLLLDPQIGPEDGRSVGVGFSPGDESILQPYWYVNAYPPPSPATLPDLPAGGRWVTEGWFGAVLDGDSLFAIDGAAAREAAVRRFLDRAIETARELLGP